jgi:hypothetical protein
MKKSIYKMREEVWLYPSEHGMNYWHFVNVSKKASREIKEKYGKQRRGFGSIPVVVTVGETSWKTSIFPNKKSGGYILPLKAEVRKKEDIRDGKTLSYSIEIRI